MAPASPSPLKKNPFAAGAEEECEVPACKTMLDLLKTAGATAATATATNKKATQQQQKEVEDEIAWRKAHCPLDKERLGDATWSMLHSTAAYYPDKPTPQEQSLAAGLIQGIAAFYPCTYCRKDFQECIKQDPPKVESRKAFSVWVCEQHNLVNEKLGKPLFDCDLGKLDKRWKTGEPRCFGQQADGGGGGKEEKQEKKIFIIEPGAGKKKNTP